MTALQKKIVQLLRQQRWKLWHGPIYHSMKIGLTVTNGRWIIYPTSRDDFIVAGFDGSGIYQTSEDIVRHHLSSKLSDL